MDTSNLLTQLGVGGILIFLFMKQMFEYLKSRDDKKKNGNRSEATGDIFALLRNIEAQTRDLHNWHDAKDEDQVFVWYVRKSLERQIEKLAGAVEKMSAASEKQTGVVEEALGAILEALETLRKQRGQASG